MSQEGHPVTSTPAPGPRGDRDGVEIDTTVAHAARVYDYLLGGAVNFSVDREAAARAGEAVGGIDNARADVRANRRFLGRAVRYLAGEAGVRQFLDIGTGIPNADNTHAIALQTDPDARVVYVDNDPIVLAHAHNLLRARDGRTAYIDGDLREPEDVLVQAAETLDLREPVAIVLVAILHLLPDGTDPYGIVARLLDAVPSGSYLALSHLAKDVAADEMAHLADRLNRSTRDTFVMRTRPEVARFFEGVEMVEPGLVLVDDWRPDPGETPVRPGWVARFYGGVGRKP
jgi:S-adenosyl methyltransferase